MMRFDSVSVATPDKASLAAEYAALDRMLDTGDVAGALDAWDAARRTFDTWTALVHLRFAQDTRDAEAKAAREYADALSGDSAAGARQQLKLARDAAPGTRRPGLHNRSFGYLFPFYPADE